MAKNFPLDVIMIEKLLVTETALCNLSGYSRDNLKLM